MLQVKKIALASSMLALAVSLVGCAGVETSKYAYTPGLQVNQISKSSDCYDASVLLGKDLSTSKAIAKKVLTGVNATVESDANNTIKAQRNRSIGLVVGGGGEELFLNLKNVSAENTFITITTKTGFVGGAGQKAWSCQIATELVKMAN
ncbi:hypothetical protein ACO0LG_22075 [Undibacterium sp. Ji42W]|uniref:hypothetical protein n=1 Tax=Undibacterium sp. Ji42W TaxID=3413039 RepID=UPI003BF2E24B